jgi:hypothetical protein
VGASVIKLFPHPATNNIEFAFSDIYPDDLLIEIRNIRGELIWSKEYNKQSNLLNDRINLKNNSPGLYFINFITDENIISKKFIIK